MNLERVDPEQYLPDDVLHFVRSSPYVSLMHAGSAASFVRRQVEAAEECATALHQYPGLEVEPLWFSYACLRSLGVCDARFFSCLMSNCSWRGVVWGSWLGIISPKPFMVPVLVAALPRASPRNVGLVRCAVSVTQGSDPDPAFLDFASVGQRLRTALFGVALRPRPVRLTPGEDLRQRLDAERERVRQAYRAGGVESARAAARGTLVAEYALDYPAWSRLAPEVKRVPYRLADGRNPNA